MRKWIVGCVTVLTLAGGAAGEPAPSKKALGAAIINYRLEEARALLQRDRGLGQALIQEILADPTRDLKKRVELDAVLNVLARLLPDPALEARLKREGLWVEAPWTPAQERETCVSILRRCNYRRELRLADDLVGQGAYQDALEHVRAGMSLRPFNDEAVVAQIGRRRGALENLLGKQHLGNGGLFLLDSMVDVVRKCPPNDAEKVDSSLSAGLELARSAEEAGCPLSARKAFDDFQAGAERLNLPIAPMIAFICRTHCYHIDWERDPRVGARVREEFEKQAQLLDRAPAGAMDSYWAARVGESLSLWREISSGVSEDWFDRRVQAWQQKFGNQQFRYALVRSRLTVVARLRRAGQLAQAESALAAVQKQLEAMPLELAQFRPIMGRPATSQEVALLRMRVQLEQARLLQARRADDPQALYNYENALRLAYRSGDQIDVLNERSPLVRRWHEPEFPEQNRTAIHESEVAGYRLGELAARAELGFYQADHNEVAEASKSLGQAIELFEKYLVDLNPSAERKEALRLRMKEVYERYAELKLKQGEAQAAFQALAANDQLQRNLSTPALRSQDPKTQQEIDQALLSKEKAAAAAGASPALVAQSKSEFFSVVRQLRAEGKNYGGLLSVQPVEFAQLQKLIPADTLLVQYYPTAGTLYFFVVSQQGFKVRTLALKKEALYQQIRDFRQLCISQAAQAASFDWKSPAGQELLGHLSQLRQSLIQPLEADLQGHKVLAVIPTEYLLYLPFPALADNRAGTPHFLVEDVAVVTLLRATDLARLGKAGGAQGSLLALGNPDGSLAGAQKEVEEIGKTFPQADVAVQQQATSARLTGSPSLPKLVHLATHAMLDRRQPNNSYLVMAGAGEAGKLTVPEIFDLPLQQTRLVTLSACQTDLGEREPGAAVSSLAEAFWVAGSPSLVASLWSVEDESTGKLMVNFYKSIESGAPLGLALQNAQVALLKESRTGHPFFWAPFVLIGDWQ